MMSEIGGGHMPVSYTHLDVYKRQELFGTRAGRHAGAREQRGRIAFGQAKAA